MEPGGGGHRARLFWIIVVAVFDGERAGDVGAYPQLLATLTLVFPL